jgi:hypothetical protein
VVDEPPAPGAADLGRRDVARQQLQAGLGARIDDPFQAGEDPRQQIAQPAHAPRLVADEIAAAADQQPDLGVDLCARIDRAQVATVADLVGDHPGVLGSDLCSPPWRARLTARPTRAQPQAARR